MNNCVVQTVLSGRNVVVGTASGKIDAEIYKDVAASGKMVVVVTPLIALARKSKFPVTITPDRLGEIRNADVLLVEHGECVLDWGEKFKPDFSRIGNFKVATLVFCASSRNLERVSESLGIRNPKLLRFSVNRKNVEYLVKPKRGLKTLVEDISDLQGSGVVFCATKKEVEETRELLADAGEAVTSYHADFAYDEKEARLTSWESGKFRVLVTTTATTWLDKADVRFVLFTTIAKGLEAFSALSSVAGRDGQACASILYFEFTDKAVFELRSPGNETSDDLLAMVKFGEFAHRCKRQQLGEFFAEVTSGGCGADEAKCSTCAAVKAEFRETPRGEEAALIQQLCAVGNRVNLRPFTLLSLRDAAVGSRSGNSAIPGFGCLKGKFTSAAKALTFMRFLVLEKFLVERTIALATGHGGHATYVDVGPRRGAVVFPEEATKKRKLQAEKFPGLSEEAAEAVERGMPASIFELELIGDFPNPEMIIATIDASRPKFKYASAFGNLFE